MTADISANLPLILLGVAFVVIVLWLLLRGNRKAKIIADDTATPLARDVLDEGAAPAARNQALIDAAPAAVVVPTMVTAPEPEPVAAPAPAPAPAPGPTATASDDLARIKGLGPKLVALLGELGVTSYEQIAAWSDADIERIDAQLGRFAGRITRDQWVEQAKLLSAGDENGFAARFGNNG
jgi:predicted flap endonuclease-1-like 5' DNA nuclease